ncbi:MAG TPA: multiheme c-type cytochrome [Stellaceae bacterium]|nr:multiheme c-type cytochrome [Stellaceae bacterium]
MPTPRMPHGLIYAVLVAMALALAGTAAAQTPPRRDIHLGVASCAGNNCHGAVKPPPGASMPLDQFLIWSQKDKHRLAYASLSSELGQRIARNLGLPDAKTAQICLDCHADNVPQEQRGRQFDLADGVGCEACHGAAVGWLGVHLSGAGHKANLAAGMYPTDQPLARAQLCLSCHFGTDKKFVTHQIMGAGHPPMPFELDTYTMIEPAHFVVDKNYMARKGKPNDAQIWAVGQAVDLLKRTEAMLDPKHAPQGLNPELVLFDCQSCHHSVKHLEWQPRKAGIGPGKLRIYDASAVMLDIAAGRVAPDAAKTLSDQMVALHQATTKDWNQVQQAATAVRQLTNQLIPMLTSHDFNRDDLKALANGIIDAGTTGEASEFSQAQQATMALASVVATMRLDGFATADQLKSMNMALAALFEAVGNDETYEPDAFVKALQGFKGTLPQ